MVNDVSIVYVQTPFHVRTFLQLMDTDLFNSKNWIVFYDKLVEREINSELEKFKRVLVDIDLTYYGGDRNLTYIYKRLKIGLGLRKKIQNYSQLLCDLNEKVEIGNFVCFSEKNIFSQLVLNFIKKTTIAWSIDEGFAHYVTPEKFDIVKKAIYPILTPIILGFSYQFYRTHGTHKRFNVLVLRLPERRLLKTSAKIISFDDIGIRKNLRKINDYKGDGAKSILILTLPYDSIRVYNEKGVKSLNRLIIDLLEYDYNLYIKPHPREDLRKYKIFGDNITLLDKSVPFEDIDYFKYSFIISEISSTAIELLNSHFPKENLIFLNIDIWGKQLKPFFKDINMLYYGESISKFIESKVSSNLSLIDNSQELI